MIKVCKFGGSSIANAAQYKKIKDIVESDISRKIIVASALGKVNSDEHKITDLLYLCIAHKKYGMGYEDILNEIYTRHKEVIDELKIDLNLDEEINNLKQLLDKKANADEIISRGEYLSSKILAIYLDAEFVDAKDVISFNYDGTLNEDKTKEKFSKYLETNKKIVVPGFYGSLPNGVIKTMSRGGSDITGALLSSIVDADVYENWTDVSGIYVADPRVIDNPKRIDVVTYAELREMSYMGASVLHDESIFPVKLKGIPINIRNTNKKDEKGTMIVSSTDDENNTFEITGVTGKKDFLVVSIAKNNSTSEVGFLTSVLKTFDNYNIPVVLLTTSIDSLSIVIDSNDVKNNVYELANTIKNELKCEEVTVSDKLALVCVVGRNMRSRKGMAGKIFSLLGEKDINIRTIAQGADEISIIVGVDEKDFKATIKTIYEGFIQR